MTAQPDGLTLLAMRDELIRRLHDMPGFRSVGISKSNGEVVLVVSVDAEEFHGTPPRTFQGVNVEVRDFGRPTAQ